jgi:hypothetical protein
MSNSRTELRRRSAGDRLTAQLATGTKPEKIDGKTSSKQVPLSEGNIKRINAELLVLSASKKKQV